MQPLITIKNSPKFLLAIGSSIAAIRDPWRSDMVAVSAETLYPEPSLKRLANKMQFHPVGKRILKEKPLLNNQVLVDWKNLKLEQGVEEGDLRGKFGYELLKFLEEKNISLDDRRAVKFSSVQDPEPEQDLAYVLTRYRQVHDILHLLLNQKTNFKGEANIKTFESIHTRGLPMAVFGGTVAPIVKIKGAEGKIKYVKDDFPKVLNSALLASNIYNIYYEERFDQDLEDLKKELNISL